MVYTYYMRRYIQTTNYTWSSDIAYLVGLITADGCLYRNGRHINLTSKDLELLVYLNNILGKSYKISQKMGGFNTVAYQINFSNTAFYDFLLQAGLTPAKSLSLLALNIPNEYYADFVRGYFDGDGTIYGYQDHRWKSSYMFYTSFASGSKIFLRWLQYTNNQLLEIKPGKLSYSTRAYKLTYAKTSSKKLFESLYYPNCICLRRKYCRWIDFLSQEGYSNR